MTDRSRSEPFRRALGCFATGVAVVTALDEQSMPVGITISSFNSVSLEPPLVLWSVGKRADGYKAFKNATHFAVNVLAKHQLPLSQQFATRSSDKFSGIPCHDGIAGVPLLSDAAASFECETEAVYPGGDHKIIVGRVLRCRDSEADPLVFFRGRFLV